MSRVLAALHGGFGRVCLYEKDRAVAVHAHREVHLIFHIGGSTHRLMVSGRRLRADDENAIVINPLQPHGSLSADPGQHMISLVLYIKPEWFNAISPESARTLEFGSNSLPLNYKIKKSIDRIVRLLIQGERSGQFDMLVFELISACHEQSRTLAPTDIARSEGPRMIFSDRRINTAITMMQERVHECSADDFVLTNIAREAGLSRPHFFKLFRSNTGVTPKVYMNALLIERALDKITNTDHSVTSIALDLGFASQPSFSRFFRANVGISPTSYRQVASLVD